MARVETRVTARARESTATSTALPYGEEDDAGLGRNGPADGLRVGCPDRPEKRGEKESSPILFFFLPFLFFFFQRFQKRKE